MRLSAFLVCSAALCANTACGPSGSNVSERSEGDPQEDALTAGQLPQSLHPLRLGMTRSEIESVLQGHQEIHLLVSPAQMSPGGRGMLANGVECRYTYVDDTVVHITTTDPRVRINGIGVGSTLTEIKNAMRNKCRIIPLPRYGTLVELSPTTMCGFEWKWKEEPITGDDKVEWFEFMADFATRRES